MSNTKKDDGIDRVSWPQVVSNESNRESVQKTYLQVTEYKDNSKVKGGWGCCVEK